LISYAIDFYAAVMMYKQKMLKKITLGAAAGNNKHGKQLPLGFESPNLFLPHPDYIIKPKYGNERQLCQPHKVHHSSDQYPKFTYSFDPFGVSYEKLE
jgi:hypothetical protein